MVTEQQPMQSKSTMYILCSSLKRITFCLPEILIVNPGQTVVTEVHTNTLSHSDRKRHVSATNLELELFDMFK